MKINIAVLALLGYVSAIKINASTSPDAIKSHSEIKAVGKSDPCFTSDPTGDGCKKYNMPLPPPPEPEPRIGYYTPEG